MNATLMESINALSVDDQRKLAHQILDNLEPKADSVPRWTPEFAAELDRRWVHHLANPDAAVSWEQVSREALAKLGDDE